MLNEIEPYQQSVKLKHRKMKFRLIGLGKNKYKTNGFAKPSYERSKSAPPIGESVNDNEMTENVSFDYNNLREKSNLYPKFWSLPTSSGDNKVKNQLNPEIREKLLRIVNDFITNLPIQVLVEDVTLTGSLANYNWSDESDVDLHILLDFGKIDDNRKLVGDYLNSKKNEWNLKNDIVLNEHEVELYVQDVNEPHYSTGVYSVLKNEWMQKPRRRNYDFDEAEVNRKVGQFTNKINNLEKLCHKKEWDKCIKFADKLMDHLKRFRRIGLEKTGEYSVENLTFKVLRRGQFIKRIKDLKQEAFEKRMGNEDPALRDDLSESFVLNENDNNANRNKVKIKLNERKAKKTKHVAAGLIAVNARTKRVLVGKRSEDVTNPGVWVFPGGKVESGESVVSAARREFAEETWYRGQFENMRKVNVQSKPFSYHLYIATVNDFNPRMDKREFSEMHWVSFDEFVNDIEPKHPGLVEALSGDLAKRVESYVQRLP